MDVGVWVGSGTEVIVAVAVDNTIGGAMSVSAGLTSGVFELHEHMTTPTAANNSNNDFNVLIFLFTLEARRLSSA